LRIEILNGVLSTGALPPGARVEVIDQSGGHVRTREFSQAKDRGAWMFFGDAPPVLPETAARTAPLAIARRSRRP
jgi:hypothetical protein